MSHKPGVYCGGIRDVSGLHCRCRIDADTGCWRWSLSMCQGVPRVHFTAPDSGRFIIARGRRAALYLARGVDLLQGHFAYPKPTCEHDDCVNPDHSMSGSRKQHGQALTASGKVKNLPSRSAASRRSWAIRRTLTDEMIAQIRSSSDSNCALAVRLGVSRQTVWTCRTGRSHAGVLNGASAFAWRPAA